MSTVTEDQVSETLKQVRGSRKRAQRLDRARIHPFSASKPLDVADIDYIDASPGKRIHSDA